MARIISDISELLNGDVSNIEELDEGEDIYMKIWMSCY